MSISVAPLTTVVMSSVEEARTGAASGINNAVSQVAGLLALAVFAPIFFHVFSPALSEKLRRDKVSSQVVQDVEEQRAKLAAIETDNTQARQAIDEAFVSGFRVVTLIAAGLALASAASAAVTMKPQLYESKRIGFGVANKYAIED
jgi:hypothetical protein